MEKPYENLVYSDNDIITFSDGVPGFEDNKKFVIVRNENYAPFEWLVCVDGTKLRFAMLNPMIPYPDYAPDISRAQVEGLNLQNSDDILMYAFVTVADNPSDSTLNLMAPVLINVKEKIGRQIILENSPYSTREPVMRS
ncbi:MAG: flagellar assembly protein FliW [Chitinivibrionia bacterium]|nr:flagellar assembly protein FliW [Chitinivibrionia bacterium]